MKALPSLGAIRPDPMLRSVLLPQPLGPISDTTSRSRSTKLTSSIAVNLFPALSRKRILTLRYSRRAAFGIAPGLGKILVGSVALRAASEYSVYRSIADRATAHVGERVSTEEQDDHWSCKEFLPPGVGGCGGDRHRIRSDADLGASTGEGDLSVPGAAHSPRLWSHPACQGQGLFHRSRSRREPCGRARRRRSRAQCGRGAR